MLEIILRYRPYEGTVTIYPNPEEIQELKEKIANSNPNSNTPNLRSKLQEKTHPLLEGLCDKCPLKIKSGFFFRGLPVLCSGFSGTIFEPKAVWNRADLLSKNEIRELMVKASCRPTILKIEV